MREILLPLTTLTHSFPLTVTCVQKSSSTAWWIPIHVITVAAQTSLDSSSTPLQALTLQKHRRHQNECVHLTCMRGHLQVFRVYMLQFILLSCSWWLIFTGLSWQSRRWKMLLYREKPELFSLSAVIYGEPVTGTTLTLNMQHDGRSLMRDKAWDPPLVIVSTWMLTVYETVLSALMPIKRTCFQLKFPMVQKMDIEEAIMTVIQIFNWNQLQCGLNVLVFKWWCALGFACIIVSVIEMLHVAECFQCSVYFCWGTADEMS